MDNTLPVVASSKLSPSTPLSAVEWVPRNRVAPLARLGLDTLADLVTHYPRRHEDRRQFDRFPDGEMDHPVCLCGTVAKTAVKRIGGWRKLFEIVVEDENAGVLSQPLTCRWFNMHFIQKMIVAGDRVVLYGRPKLRGRQIVIDHPEFEVLEEDSESSIHLQRITPIHPAGDGVSARVLRSLIHRTLQETDLDAMPVLLAGNGGSRAWRAIHFPESFEELGAAKAQLIREEFFGIQVLLQARRARWAQQPGAAKQARGEIFQKLALPFELTASQRSVIAEIRRDLESPRRMNRLLQGDVGSGKTLVALAAMLHVVESGWRAALMAPTQILAEQHYLNFRRLLEPLGISVALRTGSRKEDNAPLPLFEGSTSVPGVTLGVPPRADVSGGTPETARETRALPIHYSKRNLPHFERPWGKYMITFSTRQKRTLPQQARQLVLDAVLHEEKRGRFLLYAVCVMPDHVHLLIEPKIEEQNLQGDVMFYSLTKILHALKSFTAHRIKEIEEIRGAVWEKESFDRLIRSETDLQEKFLYITRNPWDAGLVASNEDYPFVWWPEKKHGQDARARTLGGKTGPLPHLTCAPQIIIGTHALLYESSEIEKLGLVVIDEQHKFGVLQRAKLIGRGDVPDVLVMTATPIPRTLTQTLYGDLDVSILREKPSARGEIVTAVRESGKLPEVIDFARKHLERGRQAFIVYPLVGESEKLEAKAASEEFEKWKALLAPMETGLIHGRLAPEEKESVMEAFRAGKLSALVGTTVIEVGVDVPNASIMVVENAERFGLAQLHQLRGRIGRGPHKSFCILLHDPKAPEEAREKLAVLEKTSDGFEIAEADLRLRGPGNLLGTAQTGLPPLKLGDLFQDSQQMEEAREAAQAVLESDPGLDLPKHAELQRFVQRSERAMAAASG